MSHQNPSRRKSGVVRLALASALALGALAPLPASAQVPARFYWDSLAGGNAVPLIVNSMSGNTNPFDPSHLVTPGSTMDGTWRWWATPTRSPSSTAPPWPPSSSRWDGYRAT